LRVILYQRCQQGANFSIERLFSEIGRKFSKEIDAVVAISRYPSKGFFPRLYNMVEAVFKQGDVNHVTGDVHFLTILLRKKRTLLTIHDLVTVHRLRGWQKAIFIFFWYWLPIKRCSMTTVISEFTRQDLIRHIKINPSKVRVVYDCISADFKFDQKTFNSVKPVILQVGTKENKNIIRVVQALKGILCHFRVIGKLNEKQTAILERYKIDYSSVFNISDSQIVEEYRRCDMLVFASTFEGFGMPIIEAQATGRPVVTSNVCSMPEVAGGAACLVNPYDVQDIKCGLIKVMTDRDYRNMLISKGYSNSRNFKPEYIARQYEQIYKEIYSLT